VIDALGSPQSVLVLGASSDIARATVDQLARRGGRLERIVLAGRPSSERDAAATAARAATPAAAVEELDFEAAHLETHAGLVDSVFDAGDVDVALVAFGVLPRRQVAGRPAEAAHVVTVNFAAGVSTLTAVADRMRQQGHGVIVVLSSVAGERPRRSNYLYGSTKAGLDAFATGLADDLVGTGVTVLVVRPGFVRSRMTRGMRPAPLAVDPPDVAAAIYAALRGPSRTIWVPPALRPAMSVLRHLPRAVFRRLPI
jgi:decaprenylphospho-beta-D-erythro-pentofuranosid-2-ulose 2-reductase